MRDRRLRQNAVAKIEDERPGRKIRENIVDGSLDDSSGLKIATHIWTDTAMPWAHIDAAAERHPGNMPAPPTK